MEKKTDFTTVCPVPLTGSAHIQLGHGSGGRLMHELIDHIFLPAFKNQGLQAQHDGAVLSINGSKIAYSTDSYVVHPLFFPGGDIGSLAVYGTVNDLAMCGAKPLFLSAALILEEGFPVKDLSHIVDSVKKACAACGIQLVTGDTKVVDRGKGDGIFINTTGIGLVNHKLDISPKSVQPGDVILLNGDLGRHGMAIMAVREGLEFQSTIESDSAPLHSIVAKLIDAGIEIHCMRDLTRGGLASALNEIAGASRLKITIDETKVPVREDVKGACEILGLDPLYVANEGRFIVFVAEQDVKRAQSIMKKDPAGVDTQTIGTVSTGERGFVIVKSQIGTNRILDMLSGDQLPRIC